MTFAPLHLPRILVVSRRSVRKNKFIDFVGEYHLDLLVEYGACPIIVPRVKNISKILDSFEPIHGVLLAEGEDISEDFRGGVDHQIHSQVMQSIKNAHPGDATPDIEKDYIEFELVNRCLQKGIPYFGICRGSQLLNLVAGGSLLSDIETEVPNPCKHIDYENYDAHRHPVSVVPSTPLSLWFDEATELSVNSYHHQGIKQLAHRFQPMAYSPDGLIEGFYDPAMCNPEQGTFFVGLQFHPERMQNTELALKGSKFTFDYPGCPRPYEAFVKAATMFRLRLEGSPERLFISLGKYVGRRDCLTLYQSGGNNEQLSTKALVVKQNQQRFATESARKASNKLKNLLAQRRVLESATGMYNLSKEDQRRLCGYGASVHGNRVAFKLLNDKTNVMDENVAPGNWCNSRDDGDMPSEWDMFKRGIGQVESHLSNLQGTRFTDAINIIRRLAESLSL